MKTREIDRVAPTRRPSGRIWGYQRWRALAFLHWPVDTDALRAIVPRGLEIDCFEGQAYVGLVPFRMEGVRPRQVPEKIAFNFLETNLRTYVHVDGRDPGVYFFSLDAASRIAVAVARAVWGLPYYFSEMDEQIERSSTHYAIERRGPPAAGMTLRYEVGAILGPSRPGSFEHFLMERYLLHLEKGGRIWTGQVHHAPYPAQRARVLELDETLVAAAGLPAPKTLPPIVHFASGVDVDIYDLSARQ
jgi:hypothetical protein